MKFLLLSVGLKKATTVLRNNYYVAGLKMDLSCLMRGPAPFNRQDRTGDGRRRVTAQESSESGDLFYGDEFLGRLRRQ
jgi:hypothetical protein